MGTITREQDEQCWMRAVSIMMRNQESPINFKGCVKKSQSCTRTEVTLCITGGTSTRHIRITMIYEHVGCIQNQMAAYINFSTDTSHVLEPASPSVFRQLCRLCY